MAWIIKDTLNGMDVYFHTLHEGGERLDTTTRDDAASFETRQQAKDFKATNNLTGHIIPQ